MIQEIVYYEVTDLLTEKVLFKSEDFKSAHNIYKSLHKLNNSIRMIQTHEIHHVIKHMYDENALIF